MLARWLLLIPLIPALAGCLDDLSEPLVCPAPAVVEEGDCSTIQAPLTGCLAPQEHACFAGPRTTCTCDPRECPTPAPVCFPSDDCPVAVRSIAGEGATCGRVREEDIGDFGILQSAFDCTCGCTRCMTVCDGKGPTFGATLGGDGAQDLEDFIVPLIRVEQLLPAAGRFGVYVRMRGLTLTTMQIIGGDLGGNAEEDLVYLRGALIPSSAGDGFVEHVLYDELLDEENRTLPLEWSSPADRPSVLAMVPPLGTPGHTLLEIDCVIPFWTE